MHRALVMTVSRFLLVAGGLALGLALLVPERSTTVRADLFVLLIGGLGVIEATRWVQRTLAVDNGAVAPLLRRSRAARVTSAGRPDALRQLELLVTVATRDGHTAAVRLRPRLAALANARAARVRSTEGTSMAAVAVVLAGTRDDPVPVDELVAAVDALEQL